MCINFKAEYAAHLCQAACRAHEEPAVTAVPHALGHGCTVFSSSTGLQSLKQIVYCLHAIRLQLWFILASFLQGLLVQGADHPHLAVTP